MLQYRYDLVNSHIFIFFGGKIMKKILSLVMVVIMLSCFATATSAAEMEFVEVASFDFSNADGLKGFTASWPNNDLLCNAAAADVSASVVDGAYVMGTAGFVVDEVIDATNGIKVTMDVTLDATKIGGQPWFQGIASIFNADGKSAEFLALSGEEFEHSFDAYYLNLKGNGKHFQAHTGDLGEGATGNNVVWGGDVAEDLVSDETPTATVAVEYIVLPTETGATIQILVDGVDIGLPNNPEIANFLTDEMLVTIGATHYGDYPLNVTVDNVVISTMQEKAPQTGFATIALAIVALGSGAYIVSKKH